MSFNEKSFRGEAAMQSHNGDNKSLCLSEPTAIVPRFPERAQEFVSEPSGSGTLSPEGSQLEMLSGDPTLELLDVVDGKYVCKECSQSFSKRYNCKRHIKTKHQYETYNCDLCNFNFSSYNGLKYHKQVKHEKTRFPCPIPSCSYDTRYINHVQNHCLDEHYPNNRIVFCNCKRSKKYNVNYCWQKRMRKLVWKCKPYTVKKLPSNPRRRPRPTYKDLYGSDSD